MSGATPLSANEVPVSTNEGRAGHRSRRPLICVDLVEARGASAAVGNMDLRFRGETWLCCEVTLCRGELCCVVVN
jgi:hypothetical protein